MARYAKAIDSFLRHLKNSAFMAVAIPLFLEALSAFKKGGFHFGFNLLTLYVLLFSVAVAGVIVLYQLFIKKRPDLQPEAKAVLDNALKEITSVGSQVMGGKEGATLSEVIGSVEGSQSPPLDKSQIVQVNVKS